MDQLLFLLFAIAFVGAAVFMVKRFRAERAKDAQPSNPPSGEPGDDGGANER